jgi:hypothetical protein
VIKAAIVETCLKVSDDGMRKSYDWSVAKVFNHCGEVCLKVASGKPLPDEFKKIVRFEFNKLKDSVTAEGEGWSHDRTRFGEKLVGDGVAKVRVDTFSNGFIPLDEQLTLARQMLSAVEKRVLTATAERAVSLKKRAKRVTVVIDHLVAEIERQNKLVAEVNAMSAEVK